MSGEIRADAATTAKKTFNYMEFLAPRIEMRMSGEGVMHHIFFLAVYVAFYIYTLVSGSDVIYTMLAFALIGWYLYPFGVFLSAFFVNKINSKER